MSENARIRSEIISLLHENFRSKNSKAIRRASTSLNLDPELVTSFVRSLQLLGFPVSSRRSTNIVVKAFMQIIVDQAKSQPQLTLHFHYTPKITFNMTVEQRIKVTMVKTELSEALKGFQEHKNDEFSKHWTKAIKKSMTKAARVAEKIPEPELKELLEKAEKAWRNIPAR